MPHAHKNHKNRYEADHERCVVVDTRTGKAAGFLMSRKDLNELVDGLNHRGESPEAWWDWRPIEEWSKFSDPTIGVEDAGDIA